MTVTREGEAYGQAPAPSVVEDDKVAPILYALADCLDGQLAATPGGSPCFVGIVPAGPPAMDFCDCGRGTCGMGYVRLDSLFPARQFPIQDVTAGCSSPLAARIHVGVTRCLPGMDDRGNPPTVAQQALATSIQMADMRAALRAINCCATDGHVVVLGAYVPVGPAGDCGGGYWIATFQVF